MTDRLKALIHEYRPTMDEDIVHSWAGDITAALEVHLQFDNPTPIAVMMQEVYIPNGRRGLLLIQRPDNLGWAFPSGYVETGLDSSAENAAAREFGEEVGVSVIPGYLCRSEITPAGKIMLFVRSVQSLPITVFNNWNPTKEALDARVAFEPEDLVFPTHTEAMKLWFQYQEMAV